MLRRLRADARPPCGWWGEAIDRILRPCVCRRMRTAALLGLVSFVVSVGIFYATAGARFETYGVAYGWIVLSRSAFYIGLLIGGCAFAILRGGLPERLVGWLVLATFAADPVLHLLFARTFTQVDPTHLLIDSVRFAGLSAIALRANRFWPIWLSAFQLLALAAHLAKAMALTIHPVIYGLMQAMWSYGIVIGLIVATRVHQRLTVDGAMRRSWSSF